MKFSVIIPIYNVEKYLPQCVESVLSQSFRDYEIVLVDDGSPDSCPDLCDRYATEHENIRVIHKTNGGLSSARNAGIRNSAGEYVILLDSDDFWSSENVLRNLAEIIEEKRPDVVLFRCKAWNMNTDTSRVKIGEYDFEILDRMKKEESIHYLLSSCQLPTGAYLLTVRRELLDQSELSFIEGIKSEDYDWILTILRDCTSVYATNDVHYVYRLGRAGSITNSVDLKHIQDLMVTVEKWKTAPGISDSQLRKDFLNYVAYIYSTALILSARLSECDRKEAAKILKPYREVLNSGYWRKLRVINLFSKLFGVKFTGECLNVAYRIHLKSALE